MLQERKLDMQIRFVASQYHSTPDEPRRVEMRKKLRELCSQAFDCRHRRRELQIEELEQRLDALKRRHIEQQVRREEIISQDVKNHLGPINENPATPEED